MGRPFRTEATLNQPLSAGVISASEMVRFLAPGLKRPKQNAPRNADAVRARAVDYESTLSKLRAVRSLVDSTEADLKMRDVEAVYNGWLLDEEPVRGPVDSWDEADYGLPEDGMKLETGYKTPVPNTPYLQALKARKKALQALWETTDVDLQSRVWRPVSKDRNANLRGRGTILDHVRTTAIMRQLEPESVSPIRTAFPEFSPVAQAVKSKAKKPDVFDNLFDQIIGRMRSR